MSCDCNPAGPGYCTVIFGLDGLTHDRLTVAYRLLVSHVYQVSGVAGRVTAIWNYWR